jgi:MarR family transcriptional regulator, transcriptional regulator for hemolysin
MSIMISMAPVSKPIGLALAQTAKLVGRAFDETLVRAGGSLPVWLVLRALAGGQHHTQRDLAAMLGIQGPTLTHHLNAMETEGLVTRVRLPDNRRVHRVSLTDAGEALFIRLRQAALRYDARLRRGIAADELSLMQDLLARLAANASRAVPADGADE